MEHAASTGLENSSSVSEVPSWKDVLAEERQHEYFQKLLRFVESERRQGRRIYPSNENIFNAIASTPLEKVQVVIVGQDPYHGPGQAHGLCFSVAKGVPPPPSLLNIFREIATDVGVTRPSHGCLDSWAAQGVLLLNSVLTVEEGKAGAHANIGWERFTDKVIEVVNAHCSHVVFLLWGSYAIKKGEKVDRARHMVLTAPHPSPLSAHRGFLGCRHFSKANEYLKLHGKAEIDWRLP